MGQERFRETEAFLSLARQQLTQGGVRNSEAIELGLRAALLRDGRQLLQGLYAQAGLSIPENFSRPGEKCHADRLLVMHSVFGPVELRRNYFYCETTGRGRFPLDEALGLVESFSPALVRLASRAAAREGYEAASADLAALAAVHIEEGVAKVFATITGAVECEQNCGVWH